MGNIEKGFTLHRLDLPPQDHAKAAAPWQHRGGTYLLPHPSLGGRRGLPGRPVKGRGA
ncbi:MAG: hypothetical protein SPJ13_08445 [Bacteroidales bacterium]|nr:hypothetical protein [Bacteroidales bacterium]